MLDNMENTSPLVWPMAIIILVLLVFRLRRLSRAETA